MIYTVNYMVKDEPHKWHNARTFTIQSEFTDEVPDLVSNFNKKIADNAKTKLKVKLETLKREITFIESALKEIADVKEKLPEIAWTTLSITKETLLSALDKTLAEQKTTNDLLTSFEDKDFGDDSARVYEGRSFAWMEKEPDTTEHLKSFERNLHG